MKAQSIHSSHLLLAFFAASVSLSAQSTWIGGNGDYNEPLNWSTGAVPAAGDPIIIESGTASLSAFNLARTTSSLIDGGNLVLGPNWRFLNGFGGGPAVFTLEDGTFNHTGEYFIVAQNNLGELIQNGGSIVSNITRGFFLSDSGAGSTRGRYFLNDGTLTVNIDNDSGTSADMHFHLGRANNADLFQMNGGSLTVNGIAPNRRFYLSNNATLEVNFGSTLNTNDLQYFVLGRRPSGSTNQLVINGGTVNINDLTTAMVVGGGGYGVVRLNSGGVNLTGAPLWLGDTSAARPGTWIQSGGTFTTDNAIVLSRGNGNTGQLFLRGGTVSADDITTGNGPDPRLYFEDGSLVLSGDKTSLLSQPWLISLGTATANYDAVANETVFSVAPPASTPASFRYYRFQADFLRSGQSSGTVQLAEFEFLNSGSVLDLSGVSISNPGGDNLLDDQNDPIHPPALLVDGNLSTKWLDLNNAPVVFDFGTPTTIDFYRFTTANDIPDRDPMRWSLEGSDDGIEWTLIDRRTRLDLTPSGRFITSINFPIPDNIEEAELTWSGSQNNLWNLSDANWTEVGGPRLWANTSSPFTAIFNGATPTSISVDEAVTAGILRFESPGYVIGGPEVLTIGGDASVVTSEDAELSVDLAGNSGLVKTGSSTLTLRGQNTYTGPTVVEEGALVIDQSGSSSGNGSLTLAPTDNSRATFVLDSSETVSFLGAAIVGGGQNSAAAIRIADGEFITNGPGITYLELGGGASTTKTSAFGSLIIDGGRFDSGGAGSDSGIRVGNNGRGFVEQNGGELISARWFAIGGEGAEEGEGVVNLLGGTTSVATGFRILLGDRTDSIGTLNLGTSEGGSNILTTLNSTGLSVGSSSNADRGTLNLNSGELVLGGPLYKPSANASGVVNINGATIRAGINDIDLVANSLTAVNLYRGGLAVDTNGNLARINAPLTRPTGNGVYPQSGFFAPTDGGSGYLGSPVVTVTTDGFGSGVTATTRIEDGVIAAIAITTPGQDYEIGDTLTFSFTGGGPLVPAPAFDYTLTASDVAANGTGGLTVTGNGHLVLGGDASYTGPTEVLGGTLESTALLGDTELSVAAGATLTGSLDTLGPVVVNGTLAPGSGVGFARGFEEVTFGPASRFIMEISDWTGLAGVGFDSSEFDSVDITATVGQPFEVVVTGVALTNFSEADRTFVLVDSFELFGLDTNNWTITTVDFPGTGTFALEEDDGRLVLAYTAGTPAPSAYGIWASGFPLFVDIDPSSNPDGDPLDNIVEFVLLGNPTLASSAPGISALFDESDGSFVFTFVRNSSSVAETVQVFEYSENLVGWSTLTLPAVSDGLVEITADTPEVGTETVSIRIPAPDPATTKLFGRLRVTQE